MTHSARNEYLKHVFVRYLSACGRTRSAREFAKPNSSFHSAVMDNCIISMVYEFKKLISSRRDCIFIVSIRSQVKFSSPLMLSMLSFITCTKFETQVLYNKNIGCTDFIILLMILAEKFECQVWKMSKDASSLRQTVLVQSSKLGIA